MSHRKDKFSGYSFSHDQSHPDVCQMSSLGASATLQGAPIDEHFSSSGSSFWTNMLRSPVEVLANRFAENEIDNYPLSSQYGDFATMVQEGPGNDHFSYFSSDMPRRSVSTGSTSSGTQWTSEYNPFGTINLKLDNDAASDVQNVINQEKEEAAAMATASKAAIVKPPSPPATAMSSIRPPQLNQLSAKPKYSEVVNAQLPASGVARDGAHSPSIDTKQKMPPRMAKQKRGAPLKSAHGYQTIIKPDSKYGLDNFDDEPKSSKSSARVGKTQAHDSSVTNQAKCGFLADTGDTQMPNQLPKKNTVQDENRPPKRKGDHGVPKSGKAVHDEEPYFDPRRIFSQPQRESKKAKANSFRLDAAYADINFSSFNEPYPETELYDDEKVSNGTKYARHKNVYSKNDSKTFSQPTPASQTRKHVNKKNQQCRLPPGLTHKGLQFGQSMLISLQKMLIWLLQLLGSVIILSTNLALVLLLKAFDVCHSCAVTGYYRSLIWIKGKLNNNLGSSQKTRFKGLDENIALPVTGEEAMRRLLTMRGRDPYTILGVKPAATQEDITKYYRKQAVLVHPDKNRLPGAEEAFKILAHAFDIVGEPENRRKYDQKMIHDAQVEAAMSELSELLSKMREKIKEAATIMRCDRCGGKHRRNPMDRPVYAARYCAQCKIRHAAKEGDIWAETSLMGLKWNYYSMISGHIYEVSEWATCQRRKFQYLQANSHNVTAKVMFVGKKQPRPQDLPTEEKLEEFLENLYHRAQQTEENGGQTGTATSAPYQGTTNKRKRRRRKH